MLSIILFVSGGEIFVIILFILIFFGADKIPEFMRVLNKGVREFKKASDDIKREFNENTSGVMRDIRSIQTNLTESLTKEIAEPVQKSVSEAEKTFEEYREQVDYYYQNPGDMGSSGNEYREEALASSGESTDEGGNDASGSPSVAVTGETPAESPSPKPKARTAKPKTDGTHQSKKSKSKPKT